jgi:flagellar biogenesis protein FliO
VVVVAAIAPEPEEGESRVDGGDVGFLVVVVLFVAALTWFGSWAVRRVRARNAG